MRSPRVHTVESRPTSREKSDDRLNRLTYRGQQPD